MKAALAMYSNQKQSVILSSKRNTTYNENPFPVNHVNSTNNNNNENSGTYSGRLIIIMNFSFLMTLNLNILFSRILDEEDLSTDEDIQEELETNMAILNSNSNSKQKTPPSNKKKSSLTSSTPQQQQQQLQTVSNNEQKNNSINKTSSDSTSSNANTSSTTNSNNNIHINEFYYHAQQIQQDIKQKEIPIIIQPQLPSKSELNKK